MDIQLLPNSWLQRLFPHRIALAFLSKSVGQTCAVLFPDPLSCCTDLCVRPCKYYTVLIAGTMKQALKLGRMILFQLHSFSELFQLSQSFCINFRIILPISVKVLTKILLWTVLNLCVSLERIIIFLKSLPIHELKKCVIQCIKYIHIVVQPSPLSISNFFFLPNRNSVPIK